MISSVTSFLRGILTSDIRDGGREAEDGAGQVCPRGGQRGRQDQAHLRQGLQPEGVPLAAADHTRAYCVGHRPV